MAKGIILAAGRGARLRPLTDNRPKCLVEYRGRTLLDYQVSALRECGLSEIVVVRGYMAEAIRRSDVIFCENPMFASTNMVHTLFCAEHHFGTEDIIVSYGDIVYGREHVRLLLGASGDIVVAADRSWQTLWERRMPDPLVDAETLKIDEDGRITEIGKTPTKYDDIEAQYIGLTKFTPEGIRQAKDHYDALPTSLRARMDMTSFLHRLIGVGRTVRAACFDGGWMEVDTADDLKVSVVK